MHQQKNFRSSKMREINDNSVSYGSNILQLCSGDECDFSTPRKNSGLKFNNTEININNKLKFNIENGKYDPLKLSSVIDLQRDVSTLSDGNITFYSGELIAFREDITPDIKLDLSNNNNQLIISNTINELNSFPLIPIQTSGFKFKITIYQENSYQGEGSNTVFYPANSASVILYYTVKTGTTKEIKGYCGPDITGFLMNVSGTTGYSLRNIKDSRIIFSGDSNLSGSTLTNVEIIAPTIMGTTFCPNMAGTIRNDVTVYSVDQICRGVTKNPVDPYIFFTKDRTETCITPLTENESILINNFIPLEDPYFYTVPNKVSYFKPLDLDRAIINRRYLFTNSKGRIIITSGEFIEGNFITGGFGMLPSNFTLVQFKNSIKLDDDKKNLIIDKPLNNYVQFDFKFRITIKQEATDLIKEGTTSAILEFSRNQTNFPTTRCSVNDNYGDCINYFDE